MFHAKFVTAPESNGQRHAPLESFLNKHSIWYLTGAPLCGIFVVVEQGPQLRSKQHVRRVEHAIKSRFVVKPLCHSL